MDDDEEEEDGLGRTGDDEDVVVGRCINLYNVCKKE